MTDVNVSMEAAPPKAQTSTEEAPDHAVSVALIDATKDIVSAAAWPVAIIVVVILLQKEIAKLIGSIKHIKFKDFEASVEREIEETLSDEASTFSAAAEEKTGTTVDQLVMRGPIDAIVSAWVRVETAIWELYRVAVDPKAFRPPPVSRMVSALLFAEIIDSGLRGSIRELQIVRNRTVHELDNSISPSVLVIYVQSSLQVEAQLRDKAIEVQAKLADPRQP